MGWVDYFTAAGASSAVAVAAGGLAASLRYGRKATVEITAIAYPQPHSVIIAVRPSIRAAGIFSLKIREQDGCETQVTEIWHTPAGLAEGRTWSNPLLFGSAVVGAGETIWTTILVEVDEPGVDLVGWRVVVTVNAWRILPPWLVPNWLERGFAWVWDDRIFVPVQ